MGQKETTSARLRPQNLTIQRDKDTQSILQALTELDKCLSPSLTDRGVKLPDYADKLARKACVWDAWFNGEPVAIIAAYMNREYAYGTVFAVAESCQHRGIGRRLLRMMEKQAKELEIHEIRFEVQLDNRRAQTLYKQEGYGICGDRENGRILLMHKLI